MEGFYLWAGSHPVGFGPRLADKFPVVVENMVSLGLLERYTTGRYHLTNSGWERFKVANGI